MDKDFSSVSPSAWLLLTMKAETTIPFAREALKWLPPPENVLRLSNEKDLMYWARVLHFEERYQGISHLVDEIKPHNILELSSGFNFRGLDMTEKNNNLHYIDTDLPGVVTVKKTIVDKLLPSKNNLSTYELMPLNVLDTDAFKNIVKKFDQSPLIVVNEGLLMYLNKTEKEILCRSIRETLESHGGHWITADIYFRHPMEETKKPDDSFDEFLDRHRVWENMFIDETDARQFFESQGFAINLVHEPDFETLSSFPYFMSLLTEEQRSGANNMPKLRETWQLGLK
ncbi:MAG TPA: class I SAM-dependent methyltransferase [Puia sp.]|nr:class I SAM-dependent methyltransferase [Puia sp.]